MLAWLLALSVILAEIAFGRCLATLPGYPTREGFWPLLINRDDDPGLFWFGIFTHLFVLAVAYVTALVAAAN